MTASNRKSNASKDVSEKEFSQTLIASKRIKIGPSEYINAGEQFDVDSQEVRDQMVALGCREPRDESETAPKADSSDSGDD